MARGTKPQGKDRDEENPEIVTHGARVKKGLAKGVLVADASEQTKAKNQSEEGYTGLVLSSQVRRTCPHPSLSRPRSLTTLLSRSRRSSSPTARTS